MSDENQTPVLDLDANDSGGQGGADYATTFTEDGGPVASADVDAVLTDLDTPTLQSLTAAITNLTDGAAESLSADTTGTGISANYNSGTGVLTLSGADTLANYQQVLRTVSYDNTSQNPSDADRLVTFVANDGFDDSNVATTTVTVICENDAPVLDLDTDNSSGQSGADFATTFTEDSGPVALTDADASLTDVDNSTLQSLTVTITNPLDGAAESLSADTAGTGITANYNPATGELTLTGAGHDGPLRAGVANRHLQQHLAGSRRHRPADHVHGRRRHGLKQRRHGNCHRGRPKRRPPSTAFRLPNQPPRIHRWCFRRPVATRFP